MTICTYSKIHRSSHNNTLSDNIIFLGSDGKDL